MIISVKIEFSSLNPIVLVVVVEWAIHILQERNDKQSTNNSDIRSGVIPLEYDGDEERDSSNVLLELNKRCLESTNFNDELKNLARVEIVDIYDEK